MRVGQWLLNGAKTALWLLLWIVPNQTEAWGFPMHRRINRAACQAIPEPLGTFYRQHMAYLEMHATDADSRRYSVPDEACRHFIDADHYDQSLPLDSLPLLMDSAVARFGDSFVRLHGIVPFQCQEHFYRLVWAFSQKNTEALLRYSADLGHYAADANVPLHTHSNYNGQFTDQYGIHALWETELPFYFAESLDSIALFAEVIHDLPSYLHARIETAHAALTSVFAAETQARLQVPAWAQFAFVWQGNRRKKMASWAMAEAYGKTQKSLLLAQYRASVETVASLWYTAWVMAGEPAIVGQSDDGNESPSWTDEDWDHHP